MGNLSNTMEGLVCEIQSLTQARRACLKDIRSHTQGDLQHLRRRRREVSGVVRESVQREVAKIRDSANSLLEGIASDVSAAKRLWSSRSEVRDSSKAGTEAVEQPFEAKPAARPAAELETEPFAQEDRILRVLKAHPEGIRLVDIGNELGVDWRGLIALTKALLDEGQAEKIGQLYYPVEHGALSE